MDNKDTRKKQMNNLARLWVIFILFAAIVGLSAWYFWRRDKRLGRGLPIYESPFPVEITFIDGNPDIAVISQDTYMAYLKKAYIMFGTYPDCEFYKISDKVARNDYDWENDFYVPEGEAYYNYFKDGKRSGQIAIDVSEFNGDIDWKEVKKKGITLAIVRVGFRGYGSGTIVADECFEKNIKDAAAAGIKVGVYFYSQAINRDEGIEEAKYVLEKIKSLPVKGPVVIDTEKVDDDEEARGNVISVEERTDAVVGFLETVKEAGYPPMVYASTVWFVKYLDIERIGDYPFWLACYETPDFPYHTEAWQYMPSGWVPGIDHDTDLNVWMATY